MFNKKGQADFIGNILSVIPKPLLFIFFIVLLGVIVNLLAPVFNSMGVYCDSNGDVVKLHDSNLFANINLINKLPDADDIAGEDIDPNGRIIKCVQTINGSYYHDKTPCTTCYSTLDGVEGVYEDSNDVCSGDAFKTDKNSLNWYRRAIYCPVADCTIPEGYYFESDSGKYECLGDCSSQTLASKRDEKLYDMGARPLYANNYSDNSFNGVFKFGCNDNLRVEPTIKGIALFRLEYWALIILITLLLWGLIKLGKK